MVRERRRWRAVAAGVLASLLVLAALAPAAVAGGPANGQYTLNTPSAGGGKSAGTNGRIGGSDGGSVLPVLVIAAVAVATGGVAVAFVRYRRRSGEAT